MVSCSRRLWSSVSEVLDHILYWFWKMCLCQLAARCVGTLKSRRIRSDAKIGSEGYHFVGLHNFTSVIDSPSFRQAVKNSFIFTISSQILVLIGANILALALRDAFPGRRFMRFLVLLPWVAPVSIGSIGWKWILDSVYSVVNWVLVRAHFVKEFDAPVWLGIPKLAMISVILVHTWHMLPFATVIILAGR